VTPPINRICRLAAAQTNHETARSPKGYRIRPRVSYFGTSAAARPSVASELWLRTRVDPAALADCRVRLMHDLGRDNLSTRANRSPQACFTPRAAGSAASRRALPHACIESGEVPGARSRSHHTWLL